MKKFIGGLITGFIIASIPVSLAYTGLFRDVPKGIWYEKAATNLVTIGVIQSDLHGKLYPNRPANRAEVMVMMDRLREYLEKGAGQKDKGSESNQKPTNEQNQSKTIGNPDNDNDTTAKTYKNCSPLPAPTGTIIKVGTIDELRQAIKPGNVTVLIKDGTYQFNEEGLWIDKNNVTIRSESGNRDKVILKGLGMENSTVTHIFYVASDDITIADLTFGWTYDNPIQVHGELDADRPFVHNVHIVDGRTQLF